jgi:hypothetical protein
MEMTVVEPTLAVTTQRQMRQIVSGDRKRLQEGEYDLDLSYITSQIIVMSIPGEGLEAV